MGCDTIATVYYDEAALARLNAIQDRITLMQHEIWAVTSPGWQPDSNSASYLDKQHKKMAEFFDYAQSADTVLIHGTSFAPRIIGSGYLKPAAGMADDEFTFNTNRTNNRAASATGTIHGSRAVHWAQAGSRAAYARDMKFTEESLRDSVAQTLHVRTDHPWVDDEVAKGGVGSAMLTMRLGDIVRHTPYGGYADVSFGQQTARKGVGDRRFGVVELTERGAVQHQARAKEQSPGNDVAYIAAPVSHDNAELYDYAYPIEEMTIGIPSSDPDTIPAELLKAGWTNEQIAAQTFIFDQSPDEEDKIQQRSLEDARYPRGLITTIRQGV